MKESKFFIKTLVIATLLGFMAGMVGQLMMETYFSFELYKEEMNLFSGKLVKKADLNSLKISDLAKSSLPVVVSIYQKKPENRDILKQIYFSEDLLGQGLILTSDGWMITTQEAIGNFNKEYVVITYDKKIFTAKKFVLDPLTNIVFFKVEASGLPVVKLGKQDDLNLGQTLVVLGPEEKIKLTLIENLFYDDILERKDFIKSTENFFKFIILKDNFGENYQGSPVFDLNGEAVGLLFGKNKVLPAEYFEGIISQVFKDSNVSRPYLGIHYLDLSRIMGISKINQDYDKGALIYGSREYNIASVEKNSPAQKAGLKDGDIVLKVDGAPVDKKNSLTELIQEYRTGDRVKLTILRNKGEIEVEVELGESTKHLNI